MEIAGDLCDDRPIHGDGAGVVDQRIRLHLVVGDVHMGTEHWRQGQKMHTVGMYLL